MGMGMGSVKDAWRIPARVAQPASYWHAVLSCSCDFLGGAYRDAMVQMSIAGVLASVQSSVPSGQPCLKGACLACELWSTQYAPVSRGHMQRYSGIAFGDVADLERDCTYGLRGETNCIFQAHAGAAYACHKKQEIQNMCVLFAWYGELARDVRFLCRSLLFTCLLEASTPFRRSLAF